MRYARFWMRNRVKPDAQATVTMSRQGKRDSEMSEHVAGTREGAAGRRSCAAASTSARAMNQWHCGDVTAARLR